jgi:uncharacterized protein YjiS (DUF1127 family)
MSTLTAHPPSTGTLPRLALAAVAGAEALHAAVVRFDNWRAARRRAARDRDALASMSDRELADIGVPRASVDSTAAGVWRRTDFR